MNVGEMLCTIHNKQLAIRAKLIWADTVWAEARTSGREHLVCVEDICLQNFAAKRPREGMMHVSTTVVQVDLIFARMLSVHLDEEESRGRGLS